MKNAVYELIAASLQSYALTAASLQGFLIYCRKPSWLMCKPSWLMCKPSWLMCKPLWLWWYNILQALEAEGNCCKPHVAFYRSQSVFSPRQHIILQALKAFIVFILLPFTFCFHLSWFHTWPDTCLCISMLLPFPQWRHHCRRQHGWRAKRCQEVGQMSSNANHAHKPMVIQLQPISTKRNIIMTFSWAFFHFLKKSFTYSFNVAQRKKSGRLHV